MSSKINNPFYFRKGLSVFLFFVKEKAYREVVAGSSFPDGSLVGSVGFDTSVGGIGNEQEGFGTDFEVVFGDGESTFVFE